MYGFSYSKLVARNSVSLPSSNENVEEDDDEKERRSSNKKLGFSVLVKRISKYRATVSELLIVVFFK